MKARHWEKEWKRLKRAEKGFLNRNRVPRVSGWQKKVEQYVPQKLNGALNNAFIKAFELVFDKGTGIIEKTYHRERKEAVYRVNEYTADMKGGRRALRTFERQAKGSQGVNMAASAVEGIGMGVLGLGIPDIPVFTGVLLRGIYEIALSYGFSYDSKEEQIFILKLIETALCHDKDLLAENAAIDRWIRQPYPFEVNREEQMKRTAGILAQELLYLKFVQGIPVIGVVGGFSDVIYQKKILDFAELKYHKRFLEKMRREVE